MVSKYKPAEDTPYSPLRRFKGTLSEITESEEQGQRGTYVRMHFGFTDVDVIEATEPYPFPIASISMGLGKASSRWGVWWKSAAQVLGTDMVLDDNRNTPLLSRRQEWAMLPAMLRQPLVDVEGNPVPDSKNPSKQAWGDVEVDCWQVVSADGISSPADVTEDIIAMVDGKTDTEFHQAFQQSQLARDNVSLMTENVNRLLLPRLEKEGKIARTPEGVWHIVNAQPRLKV